MPGVPHDAVTQVKKGFKSLFKKKLGHEEQAPGEPYEHTLPPSYEPPNNTSIDTQQTYPSAPISRKSSGPPRDENWKDIDQPPPPPPKKDYPPKPLPPPSASTPPEPPPPTETLDNETSSPDDPTTTEDTNVPPSEPQPQPDTVTNDNDEEPTEPESNVDSKASSETQVDPPGAESTTLATTSTEATDTTSESVADPKPDTPIEGRSPERKSSAERDESPIPQMSATSGPLLDHPAFQ